ncbi:MAG: VCBS repeat-containing protein [Verrucomicrobiota bacterium]
MPRAVALCLLFSAACLLAEEPPVYQFESIEIDQITIGYGLALTDADGDGDVDIFLADKRTVQWYENPEWVRHTIAEDLTVRDNVCIAARDIDGDGRAEVAVGGQWNFLETLKDGAVTYLVAPEDPRKRWTAISLQHEPSVHRMHWIESREKQFTLVVKPLRGRGSLDGNGRGIRILEYFPPGTASEFSKWPTRLVGEELNLSHNFDPVNWDDDAEEELIVAAKQGVWHFDLEADGWKTRQLSEAFAGEVRDGTLPGGRRFFATIEPMHGTAAAVYVEPEAGATSDESWPLSATLKADLVDGHAVAVGDFLGVGSDQVVIGWRAMKGGVPGIRLYTPLDQFGKEWRETLVSEEEVAVEDIKAADLNQDGRVDFVAAGRKTKNLRIYFSRDGSRKK